MPAIAEEVEEAIQEGVEFIFNAVPVKGVGKNGRVKAVACLRTKPGKPDVSGRKKPVPIKGSDFLLPADSLILAVGQRADLSSLPEGVEAENGLISADLWGKTTVPGVYAGGDAATGRGYVSHAIASGKRAALSIDRFLRKERFDPPPNGQEIAGFARINLDYFPQAPRVALPSLEVRVRAGNFREVHGSIRGLRGLKEAGRCFSCGHCIRCNVCLVVCPDVAISFDEKEKDYLIDMEHCKGCGICVVECPRSAMTLEEEKWSE
jgi:NADPH-dependent glutamate synthase beta subunit-like oxidoreductase